MNLVYGSIIFLLAASGVPDQSHASRDGSLISAEINACARKIGALKIASSLDMIPKEVRGDLDHRIEAQGSTIAEHDTPLLQTDAPGDAERGFAQVRFAQALLVNEKWFVQLQISQFPGVRTFTYGQRPNGKFVYLPGYHFGGPACASIEAALSGVNSFADI
jgi:hypothetical protein